MRIKSLQFSSKYLEPFRNDSCHGQLLNVTRVQVMVHRHLPGEVLHAEVADKRILAGGGKPTQPATELLGAQVDAEVSGERVRI